MFDPYEKWLGISKDERPVTYYRLLDVSPKETDAAVIANAAKHRAAQLQTHQEGPLAPIHTRLSKEIAQAQATLLDSAKRQRYDSVLRKLAAEKAPESPEPRDATDEEPCQKGVREIAPGPLNEKRTKGKTALKKEKRERKLPWRWLVGGAAVLLVLGGAVVFIGLNRSQTTPPASSSPNAVAQAAPSTKVKNPPVATPVSGKEPPKPAAEPVAPTPAPAPPPSSPAPAPVAPVANPPAPPPPPPVQPKPTPNEDFPTRGKDQTVINVHPARIRQVFEGLGAGTVLFEGHITSLAARGKDDLQQQLYDDMFARVPTRYLQVLIREVHEPDNDNDDPYTPSFDEKNFEYCKPIIACAKAALKRRPEMQFFAVMETPPPWMKTNGDASGGGEARATLKPGLELKFAAYIWAFLAHMQKNGVPIQYLTIANECDWPHTQPGCFFPPDRYAVLFKTVGDYLDKMAQKYPDVPRPKLVGPNTLSAVAAVKEYVPRLLQSDPKHLDVIAAHDYDPRGDRWGALRELAGKRPVWMTEWCARDKDASPGMIESAIKYGVEMHEAFQGGANVFMAYDWVYPPRDSGEALIHVDWGNGYRLTKPYHLFRQWAEPLEPGMRVVETGCVGGAADGVKATTFLAADGHTLVVHVVNAQNKNVPIVLKLTGKFTAASTAMRNRTSAKDDVVALEALAGTQGAFKDTLPALSMVTYRIDESGK